MSARADHSGWPKGCADPQQLAPRAPVQQADPIHGGESGLGRQIWRALQEFQAFGIVTLKSFPQA